MKRTLRVAAAAGLFAVALTLALTACGGDGGGDSDGVASLGGQASGSNGSTTTEQDPEQAALDYARCMREHGVDMPDPSPGGGLGLNVTPANEDKVRDAQRACSHILDDVRPRLSEEQQNVMQDALLAFAKCMRKHGIDMPDPEFGKGGRVTQKSPAGRGFDPEDPDFKEAQGACEPIMDEARRKAGLPEGKGKFQRSGP
jgi:hypothetical protein